MHVLRVDTILVIILYASFQFVLKMDFISPKLLLQYTKMFLVITLVYFSTVRFRFPTGTPLTETIKKKYDEPVLKIFRKLQTHSFKTVLFGQCILK